MKQIMMWILAKRELAKHSDSRIRKAHTGTLYVEKKHFVGHNGFWIWYIVARISDHYPTKGKGKIRKIKDQCKVRHIIVHNLFNIEMKGGIR